MELETTRFGKIEVNKSEIITFQQGLYGFKDNEQFILLEDEETEFFWLQSVTNPELAFIVTEPWSFCADYQFDLDKEVEKELKLESKEEVLVINIVVIPDNPKEMTMNLKAPIVINQQEKLDKQLILDDYQYPVKYPLFNDKQEVAAGN